MIANYWADPPFYKCRFPYCRYIKNYKEKKALKYWTIGIIPYRNAMIDGYFAYISKITVGHLYGK